MKHEAGPYNEKASRYPDASKALRYPTMADLNAELGCNKAGECIVRDAAWLRRVERDMELAGSGFVPENAAHAAAGQRATFLTAPQLQQQRNSINRDEIEGSAMLQKWFRQEMREEGMRVLPRGDWR